MNRPESLTSEATTLQTASSLKRTPSQASYSSTIKEDRNQSEPNQQDQPSSSSTTEQPEPVRQQYVYVKANKKGPQPDYQTKPMSRLSKFMSKFQSPAVKATNSIREKGKEEDIKSGVTRTQVSDVGRSSNAWALS